MDRHDPDDRFARRWLAAVLGGALALLAGVAAFNAWVDPFQQYHLATRFPPRFYSLHHRYIDPGLARNARYDTIVVGSSIMENARNSETDAACGGTAVNLAMPAQSAMEQALILRTALDSRQVKRAIVVLDFNAFAGPPDARQAVAGPLPAYLYDRNPFNDLPYLLSAATLLRSLRVVAGDTSEDFTTDPDAPWLWAPKKRFARDEVLRGLDLAHLNARFQQPPRTLEGMRASFDANLLPILRAHPDTEFDLVWPPYSILVFLDFAQRGQLDLSLAFKRYVFDATRGLPNVRITDLQADAAITHDLDRYTDLYHFAPDVSLSLVQGACGGRERFTAETLYRLVADLRAQVAAVQSPEGLARLVGGANAAGKR
jgi:hypothetical protein